MNPSVVILGAGVGGLAAAIHLAKAGFIVRVVEARAEPGGLASGVTYDGLSFDAGPYIVLDRDGMDWLFRTLDMQYGDYQVPLEPIDDVYQVQLRDGSCVRFYSNLEMTAEDFDARWPGCGKRYEKFVSRMDRVLKSLRPLLFSSSPRTALLSRPSSWWHAPFLARSLASVLESADLPRELTEALAIWTHVAGQTTSEAPSPLAFVPALIHTIGAYYPAGGMRALPKVLAEVAVNEGVLFSYSTKVSRIRCEGGRAIGVETNAGQFIKASAVLSNSSALSTYLDLLDPSPPAALKLKALPLQSPGVCAYLAVQGRVSPPYLHFKLGESDGRCRLLIQQTVVERTKEAADWLPARLMAPMNYAEAQRLGPSGQEEYLDRLLEEPWWRKDFSAVRVLSKRIPRQWGSEYNLYADSMNPVMTARFMRQGRVAHRSPYVRGLYLAGSSTHPGQWVSFCMISGILAANCIIKDLA